MIIQYIAYSISLISILSAAIFFIVAGYIAYKHSKNFILTQKSIKGSTKFLLLGMTSLFSSFFFFLTAKVGFSTDLLGITLIFLVVFLFMIIISTIINLDAAAMAEEKNIQPFSDLEQSIKRLKQIFPFWRQK